MKTLWNSRTASEYRMQLLYICSTSFSSCSFTANSPAWRGRPAYLAVGGAFSRGGNTTVFDENKCAVTSGPYTENTKEKGCDIGYALATDSCEEADSEETCTVTAFDAITAFAVPNPNSSSQSSRFFQVWRPNRSPCRADHPAYFGLAKFYLSQPFRPSTFAKLNR